MNRSRRQSTHAPALEAIFFCTKNSSRRSALLSFSERTASSSARRCLRVTPIISARSSRMASTPDPSFMHCTSSSSLQCICHSLFTVSLVSVMTWLSWPRETSSSSKSFRVGRKGKYQVSERTVSRGFDSFEASTSCNENEVVASLLSQHGSHTFRRSES